jgi:hypothetical protein
MNKRFLTAGLWLFAALYAGSVLHGIVGLSELLGPVVGLATAAVIFVTPQRVAAMLTQMKSEANVVAQEVASKPV